MVLMRSCLPSRCDSAKWKPQSASVRVKVHSTNKSSPFLLNLGCSFCCRTNTMSPVWVSGCSMAKNVSPDQKWDGDIMHLASSATNCEAHMVILWITILHTINCSTRALQYLGNCTSQHTIRYISNIQKICFSVFEHLHASV